MRALLRGLAIGLVLGPITAGAATITVDTTVDDTAPNGNCTLREAVIAANTDTAVDGCAAGSGADAIEVPAGTYVLAIAGTEEDAAATGDVDIIDDVDIVGAGTDATIVEGRWIDRVLDVDPAATGIAVTIRDLTVTGGNRVSEGGGIRNAGDLSLTRVRITGNEARGANIPPLCAPGAVCRCDDLCSSGSGECIQIPPTCICHCWWDEALAQGGGIMNTGQLSLAFCEVLENKAIGWGAIGVGAASGGGIESTGSLVVIDSTVADNVSSVTDYNVAYAGGIGSTGTLGLIRTSISGNTAEHDWTESPGGDSFFGGVNSGGPSTFVNSTISNNHSFTSLGGEVSLADATIDNCTIVDGVGVDESATAIFRNSIISWCDRSLYSGTIIDDGYNLDVSGSCFSGAGGLSGVDPLLGPLQDNGGATETHALLEGSPAIDAGSPAPPGSGDTACETTDQRGLPRPGGARCDIGAFEVGAPLPGDCDGDGRVTIDELIIGVRIALGQDPVARCPLFDRDGNGWVTVGELIAAVRALSS